MSSPSPAVEARDLVKDFKKLRAVDHVSFSVRPGEIVGVLGPNGAGKTTNDDIVCTPAVLQEHDCAHRDGDQCVVIGMVFMDDNSPATLATDWVRACTDRYVDRVTRMKEPIWPDDASVFANVSVSRSALLSCGGFDDSLVGSCQSSLTDNDLGLRLWEMGLRFRYQPTAVAYQIYVKSSSQLVLNDE